MLDTLLFQLNHFRLQQFSPLPFFLLFSEVEKGGGGGVTIIYDPRNGALAIPAKNKIGSTYQLINLNFPTTFTLFAMDSQGGFRSISLTEYINTYLKHK